MAAAPIVIMPIVVMPIKVADVKSLPATRRNALALGTALAIVIGILASAVAWIGLEVGHHAWAGGTAPHSVHLTAGQTYQISVPGGTSDDTVLPVLPGRPSLSCSYQQVGRSGQQQLTVSSEDPDTKATNVIGSFTAPISGSVTISCDGFEQLYIDDADDVGFDWATLALLVCSLAWLAAVAGGLGLLWQRRRDRAEVAADDPVDQRLSGSETGTSV